MRQTARVVLETTPQGQAAAALVVKWLMENQETADVIATVSTLVDRVSDNPAARIATLEIAERVQLAAQALAVPAGPPQRSLGSPGLACPYSRPALGITSIALHNPLWRERRTHYARCSRMVHGIRFAAGHL